MDIEFKDEFGAWLRAGPADTGCLDADGKFNKTIQDPILKFKCYVDIISRKLISDNINIGERDIENMMSKAESLQYISFKNPSAYIAGYIASSGGKNITETSVTYCFTKVLPLIELEGGVQRPDIIRYARLWMKIR
tara:strand:- start:37 stop:444 length:408 start_codon:yes stop_codon:yes gene_type:complete